MHVHETRSPFCEDADLCKDGFCKDFRWLEVLQCNLVGSDSCGATCNMGKPEFLGVGLIVSASYNH